MEMNWNHTLLGAGRAGIKGANTSRYSRLELLAKAQGVSADVVAAYDDEKNIATWQPIGDASAPLPSSLDPRCTYDGRGRHGWPPKQYNFQFNATSEKQYFGFGFWNTVLKHDLAADFIVDSRFPRVVSGASTQAEAHAWYVQTWPFGGGEEAVFLDAFYTDPDSGELILIPDDFVTVAPDDPAGDLTREANNGLIHTSRITSTVTVTAQAQLDAIYQGHMPGATSPGDPGAIAHPKLAFTGWRSFQLLPNGLADMESISELTVEPNADRYAWAVYDAVPVLLSIPDPFYSDAIFIMQGSDGPVWALNLGDLANGYFHPRPAPDPGFAALVKSQFSSRILQWANLRTPNPRELHQLRSLAKNAQHTGNRLVGFLNALGQG